jgi:hypothetical protein
MSKKGPAPGAAAAEPAAPVSKETAAIDLARPEDWSKPGGEQEDPIKDCDSPVGNDARSSHEGPRLELSATNNTVPIRVD